MQFYKFVVTTQVFHSSEHSFALVNLKPLVPGHVLVVPRRQVATLGELPSNESVDFFQMVTFVEGAIRKMYAADGMNLAIQDGLAAGQSVPHLHCHIIPRYLQDGFGDDIYKHLETWEGGLIQCRRTEGRGPRVLVPDQPWFEQVTRGMNVRADSERVSRDMPTMESEALKIKQYIQEKL